MEEEIDFKKYCLNVTSFSFKVNDFDFTCEELTNEEEADMIEYYITKTGKQNLVKLRMVQATKLTNHPFNSRWVSYVFSTFYPKYKLSSSEWNELTIEERYMFITKLEKTLISGIIQEINKYFNPKEQEVKNL